MQITIEEILVAYKIGKITLDEAKILLRKPDTAFKCPTCFHEVRGSQDDLVKHVMAHRENE